MQISADQCRAARSLLNWTQDQLAKNANVSRATVVDFESSSRQPMTNNLRSIADSMFAAGIEFIPEEDGKGVGVRFRERKLEYINNIRRIDLFNGRATMRMRFAGEDFLCHIELDAVIQHHQKHLETERGFAQAISEMQHVILATAERHAETHIRDGEMTVTRQLLTSQLTTEIKADMSI
ncbi:MAG: helix-turn-helix transcriptional regulator [Rhizobiales bacterium]|nr:helix-turn-helix transcriptional regulator [Hyphomicrobiales bacterium]